MTAVLEQIRKLEAAHDRGDIGEDAFLHTRKRLLDSIEDAELVGEEDLVQEIRASTGSGSEFWLFLLMIMAGFFICTALGSWLLGDLTLALTLSITVLAAVCVRAFRSLEED